MAKNSKYVTQKEMGALINNAVFSVLRTPYFLELEDEIGADKAGKRRDRLRAYTEAHFSTLKDHLNVGYLNADEALLILLSEALLVAGLYYKNVKLPMFADLASRLLDDEEPPYFGDNEDE